MLRFKTERLVAINAIVDGGNAELPNLQHQTVREFCVEQLWIVLKGAELDATDAPATC